MTNNNLPALDALANKINIEHEACHAAVKKGLNHALEAGRLLLEAKAGLAHGEWLPWLKENCPDISERSTQRYMRLAGNREVIESATVADLTMQAAEESLAAPHQFEGNIPQEAPRLSWSERMANWDGAPYHQEFLERCLGSMMQADYVIVREVGTRLKEIRDQELHKPRGDRAGINRANRVRLESNPDYNTFEEWLSEEGDITAEIAEELIDAATMLNNPRAAIQAELLTKIQNIAPGISVSPVGLELPDDLSGAQWIEIGELLSAMPGCNLRDLGDKAIWGE